MAWRRSYREIMNVLTLLEREDLKQVVYRGSTEYLPSETEPVISDAAKDLAERAMNYTEEASAICSGDRGNYKCGVCDFTKSGY